jgi:hypothetical protein
MKIRQLKLAESIRINPQSEERFFDFEVKFKNYDCYYKEGLIYIIGNDGTCSITSIANIRQMIPYDNIDLGITEGTDKTIGPKKIGRPKIA